MKKQKGLKQVIAESDERILSALEVLRGSDRGNRVLKTFKKMYDDGAGGLDCAGMEALVTLTKELAFGRRDFLSPSTCPALAVQSGS